MLIRLSLRRRVLLIFAWLAAAVMGRSLCRHPSSGRPKPVARKVACDVDFLSPARSDRLADAPTDRLTCVVLGAETTGLGLRAGDQSVQLATTRIVNGCRVGGEVFDTRVNPGRPIPQASTDVHGFTAGIVADPASALKVVRSFHMFAEGAVLIAHDAPFDMEFLRRVEGRMGLTFGMPVQDTVLLSAVVNSPHDVHGLDTLAHRLGITIPKEARLAAIGDLDRHGRRLSETAGGPERSLAQDLW